MAGRKSPKPPAQPRMVQRRTGSAGTTKGDMATRGKNTKADVNEHTRATPGQQAPKAPTKPGPNTPFPQKGRSQSSVPERNAREGIKDQASKGTGQSLFQRMDARNRRLSQRNRPTA
jgi:hypothetical protein